MEYLFELVSQKKVVEKKIEELNFILQYDHTELVANELFHLLERKQALLISIDTANSSSVINIGGQDITISAAIRLKNKIKEQIDVLTSLINNKDCNLNKIELQKQRDKQYESYILLSMGVLKNDLQVSVSQ